MNTIHSGWRRLLKNLQAHRLYAPQAGHGFLRIFVILALVAAGSAVLLCLVPVFLVWSAPRLDLSKDLYAANRPIAFTFLDADGHVAGHRGAIVGERLKLGQMPPYLPAAFIAMEDRSFYENDGIDLRGLVRAMWMDFRAGHVVAGGSTITQQTAKIIFLSPQRTFSRKYEELLDAAALEKSLSKKQILELYLNRIYLGSGAYGVDGAAHVYFGKSARDLTLPEAAMLATLTRAPSAFSPRRDLAAAQTRANLVLRAMKETGAITAAQARDAMEHPAVIIDRTQADARNFFLDTAADEALRLAGSDGEARDFDLIVHTTLQPRLQEAARHALAHTLNAHGRRDRASEGAIVLMKSDGAVAALVGGRDYDASVFDRATQAKRQPGSAFKPFVYLAALESGISPWDERDDGPVDIDGWTPTNYGGRSYGTVTLAEALAHSINTVTAKLAQEVGIRKVVAAAQRCGITSPLAADASLALGTSVVTPLELTAAYATFASGGLRVTPYFVTAIEDSTHHVLYRREPPKQTRVIAPDVNRDLTAMLYDVVVEGTGRAAALGGREAAGKTGTTQDYRDAWFVGFTPDYVAGVWVGNDNYSPMRGVTGGSLPAGIWKTVMTAAERGLPVKRLDKSAPPPPPVETAADDTDGNPDNSAQQGDQDDESAQGAESAEGAQPAQGTHRSFWDWLFGNRNSSSAASQQSPAADPASPPTARTEPAPSDAQNDAPQSRNAEAPPADADDTPPGGDYDDDEAGPPPASNRNAPPPAVLHRYVPPPPPPSPDDDDGGNGN
ncbi:MAG TPA: PBP1A family penicillin-binding protein [Rhizomicrobium sp.]|jgi:penicillin-binding protein 1A|nr:PBP1A family penicillin-binding protein [Rhizomicrobium sp.]